MNLPITLTVNGATVEAQVSDDMTLLRFLRDELRLTGTKNGCSHGDCWACTVLVDGAPTRACLTKLSRLGGKTIETIEGLAVNGQLHPLQEAFINRGAVQCGFCTPGMIMQAKAFLDEHSIPTVGEITGAMGDHLCRCTGYVGIIEAIQGAARVARGDQTPDADSFKGADYGEQVIGASIHDKDGVARVTGRLKFADDLYLENMLWGKILYASVPHGEIVSIDTSAAEAMPGVRAVLTAKDVPGPNVYGEYPPDRPVLCDKRVRILGDVVAVVFAEKLKQAEKAARAIRVEYRRLPVVSSPQRALEPNAPLLHDRGNLLKRAHLEKGDVARGFAESDVVVEGSYRTQIVEHAYMEPQAGVARPTADGGVEIYCPAQKPFAGRTMVARNLCLDVEKVRLVATPIGGGFGGKADVCLEILLGLGAVATGRPVKITLSRAESLRASPKRHPYYVDCRIGARKDGTLLAARIDIVEDAGGYAGLSATILEQAMVFAGGPYRWPNARVEGLAVNTNNPSGTAFRGMGIPQVNFAMESTLDTLARKLGMDPFELRLKNALRDGDVTITGEKLGQGATVAATLEEARKALKELPPIQSGNKIGVGIAAGHKNVGAGRGSVDTAGAIVELLDDGRVLVRASAVDLGQGVRTILGQIAAAATGVAYDGVDILTGDTALVPPDARAIAQRQTFLCGNAVLIAAREFKKAVQAHLAHQYDLEPERIAIEGDRVVDTGAEKRTLIGLAQLGRLTNSEGEVLRGESRFDGPRTYPIKGDAESVYVRYHGAVADDALDYRNYPGYTYLTQVAVVEVEEATGEVKVRRIISCNEVGRALNPQKIKGQLESAAVMGMGYALSEEFVVENGVHRTTTLGKCGIPTMHQIPEVVLRVVEEPDPNGPFGAKAVSEVATVPTAAAITNAIYDAVGVRISSLPATKEKVLRALREA